MAASSWDCLQGRDLHPIPSDPLPTPAVPRMGGSSPSLLEQEKAPLGSHRTGPLTKASHQEPPEAALGLFLGCERVGVETGRQCYKDLIFPTSWGDAGW